MNDQDWASVARLQDLYRAAKDQRTRDLLEDAIDREVNAIAKGQPRTGTLQTANDNFRSFERNRFRLQGLAAPVMDAANDPWPVSEWRIARDQLFARMNPSTRRTFSLLVEGYTYEEAAAIMDEPVGTLKSRTSRARARFA